MANYDMEKLVLSDGTNNYILKPDTTLAKAGVPADANKTGVEIEGLKGRLIDAESDVDALETATEGLKTAYNTAVVETATGAVASFADGGEGLPMKSLVVNIAPVQSGSGDPSPTNERPITGWTGANVNACGVNFWDEEWEVGGIKTSDGDTIASQSVRSKNFCPIIPSFTYYVRTAGGTENNVFIFFYDNEKNYISYGISSNTIATAPSNARYFKIQITSSYGVIYKNDVSINYPSTDHDYHKGDVTNISVDWSTEAGTVYGGTLDVVSGVLTVDKVFKTFTGSENWVYTASVSANTDRVLLVTNDAVSGQGDHKIASNYIGSSINNAIPWSGYTNGNGVLLIMLPIGEFASAEEWKTYLASHNLQVCYYLQTPLTIQLTAHEVRTLLGANNVWADCGDVDVTYRADTKLFIESLTEPDADMVADANIVSGQYFMVGNTLYKATANIASGASIVPNVNCTRKSLSEALNELNA